MVRGNRESVWDQAGSAGAGPLHGMDLGRVMTMIGGGEIRT